MLVRLRQLLLAYTPALIWYAFLFWLSSNPQLPGPGDSSWRDYLWFKTGHVLAYLLLTASIWWGSWLAFPYKGQKKRLKIFMTVIVLACLDELHQAFVPGRTARMSDVLIDASASAAALWALQRYNAVHRLPQGWRKKFGM